MNVIHYPDISSFDAGINFGNAYVVCAKATQGTGYVNPEYAGYRSEAARQNVFFIAYHFLTAGNAKAQADHYCSVVAAGTPGMVDVEPAMGSNPGIADAETFITECRKQGRPVYLTYLPRWYWLCLGSPALPGLAALGQRLVTSDYTAYSDTGPGWEGYGGLHVAAWQYSSTVRYGGISAVDFNAFKGSGKATSVEGTLAELKSFATTGR
jgi:GH25 family lysozyme M1 (1,4-beta-N-acetylmuramidase)